MDDRELPPHPNLDHYERLAKDLVAGCEGDTAALQRVGKDHGLERAPSREEIGAMVGQRLGKLRGDAERGARLALADARLLVADRHAFESWSALAEHIVGVNTPGSPLAQFESAVDAVIAGDVAALGSLLRANPALVHARSKRKHRSTLLHYVSANGVEGFRQKTPANIVEITRLLLASGAEVDAENEPGRGTTLGLVATSIHPVVAGVQVALLEALLDAGASVDGASGGWTPLNAALANGRGEAADFLARRGARLDLEGAAGVGRLDVVQSCIDEAGRSQTTLPEEQMRSAFAWACEYGRTQVVEFLLQKGMAVDARLRHHGQLALHWAAFAGHAEIVKVLLDHDASVDARDPSFEGTPLGWALYGWAESGHAGATADGWSSSSAGSERGRYLEVVELLVRAGGTEYEEWLADPDRGFPIVERIHADSRMLAALRGAISKRDTSSAFTEEL